MQYSHRTRERRLQDVSEFSKQSSSLQSQTLRIYGRVVLALASDKFVRRFGLATCGVSIKCRRHYTHLTHNTCALAMVGDNTFQTSPEAHGSPDETCNGEKQRNDLKSLLSTKCQYSSSFKSTFCTDNEKGDSGYRSTIHSELAHRLWTSSRIAFS